MSAAENTPYFNDTFIGVAGCTNDGLVYAASIRENDVILWVHSGVQEKWHALATSQLPSGPYNRFRVYPNAAVLTHDQSCVDVFVEMGTFTTFAFIFRFFISNPKENCIYSCIEKEKIQFGDTGPSLAWLGRDCLLLASTRIYEYRFHIWRLNLDEKHMAFTFTEMLAFDTQNGMRPFSFRADEDFLYLFGPRNGEIKLYQKSNDGAVQLRQTVIFPISQMYSDPQLEPMYSFGHFCVYPSTYGNSLFLPHRDRCYMFDFNSQSVRQVCNIPRSERDCFRWCAPKICIASSAQFFWVKVDGTIGQVRIGMPSLQYMCLRKLCETWPALKMCTDEKKARKMGIPYPIWNRFFKLMVLAEDA